MTTIEDIENLIARVGLGGPGSFSLPYDATSAKLFGVCLRMLNNRTEAEDALQKVFVRIWQKAGSHSANGYSPKTWLITLTRNLAIAASERVQVTRVSKNCKRTAQRRCVAPTWRQIAIKIWRIAMACR